MKSLIDAYKLMAVGFIVLFFTLQANVVLTGGMFVGSIVLLLVLTVAICMIKSECIATPLFIVFAGLTGIVLTPVIMSPDMPSGVVITALLLTAAMFIGLTLYAIFSGKDFSAIGGFLFAGLCIIIVASVINIFIRSNITELVISSISAIIFSGFILYDTQDIIINGKYRTTACNALNMFLNVLNLFLDLIRIVK